MKLRNYEKRCGILFLITIFFIAICGLVIYTVFFKVNSYYLIRGVVFKDDLLEVMVSDEELKILHKNGHLYIKDKEYDYNISDVILDALVRDKNNYNIVYIECKLDNEKENDIVDLVFLDERVYLFKIFELIWKGD